jgi:hypothetical protein
LPDRTLSSRYSAAYRHHGANHPATIAAARDMRAANLTEHVRRVVDGMPPLTPKQRDEIAALLRTAPASSQGAA